MNRFQALCLAAAAAAALAGCPLPQPLPDYPPGTVTPPRILVASATRTAEPIIPVPAGCSTPPEFELGATLFYDQDVTLEARWFVDYKAHDTNRQTIRNTVRQVLPDDDPSVQTRSVPAFRFHPYDFAPAEETGIPAGTAPYGGPGLVHVVELVVSNGFDSSDDVPEPNRTPAHTTNVAFEVQVFRWTFVNVAGLPCPGAPPPG